jgi:RNA polymerase sigma-70 factor, ECF subfamily
VVRVDNASSRSLGAVTDVDFEALLAGARNGDERAFTSLFQLLQPALLRYLRAQVPRQAADDCAGEVWAAVAARLRHFEGGADGFRAWLFTIARNQVVDHHRRTGRQRTDVVAVPPERAVDGPDQLVVSSMSAQDAVDLMRVQLTDEQFEVVMLRVLADLDADDVAISLGRSAGWVRVTQHRAVRRLHDRLGHRLESDRNSV